MTRDIALKMLIDFVNKELRGKVSGGVFYQINGDRICSKCRASKRRTLYIIIDDGKPVALKCFRTSCTADFILNNPGVDRGVVPITRTELLTLGFKDEEAIEAILDCTGLIRKKSRHTTDNHILKRDRVLSSKQEDYFNKRCNFKPNLYDVGKYHIVPNLCEVMEDNDVEVSDEMCEIAQSFNKNNAITFICSKLTLSTRAIDNTPKLQKSIINLGKSNNSSGYVIGDKINDNHTLVISEGIFDIINAERHIANFGNDKEGVLYVASLGFTKTLHIIEHYYYQNIESMKNLIIFMDSDITKEVNGQTVYTYNEYQIYNLIKGMDMSLGVNNFHSISLCYNTKEKDCGDLSKPMQMKRVDIDKVELYRKYRKWSEKKYDR